MPPTGGAIGNDLLTNIRRAQTVGTRTDLMVRGLIKQANAARESPELWAAWQKTTTDLIPEYCAAMELGMAGQANQAKGASPKTGG
jgi:hypothetical protein